MRISDWSSDVCSSDLEEVTRGSRAERNGLRKGDVVVAASRGGFGDLPSFRASVDDAPQSLVLRILRGGGQGRSEERRVGKSVSVRVDLGGRRIIKKKTKKTTVTMSYIER